MIYLCLIISADCTWSIEQNCKQIFFDIMYLGRIGLHTIKGILDMLAVQFQEFALHQFLSLNALAMLARCRGIRQSLEQVQTLAQSSRKKSPPRLDLFFSNLNGPYRQA